MTPGVQACIHRSHRVHSSSFSWIIEGLSPSIAIDQKTTSRNPRSTVGTITEVYDFLRLLFARVGHPHCPDCGREISRQSIDQIVNGILELVKLDPNFSSVRGVRFLVLSPLINLSAV